MRVGVNNKLVSASWKETIARALEHSSNFPEEGQ